MTSALHRAIACAVTLCALALGSGCADAHLGTETGNPPVWLEPAKVRIEMLPPDQVRVTGEPGAVNPGGALVVATNVSSGDPSASVTSEEDGSFAIEMFGSPDDAYYLQAEDWRGRTSLAVALGGRASSRDVVQLDTRKELPPMDAPVAFQRVIDDVDGDGLQELLLHEGPSDSSVAKMHLVYGSRSLRSGANPMKGAATFCGVRTTEAGDFDGDGLVDLLTLDYDGDCAEEGTRGGTHLLLGGERRAAGEQPVGQAGVKVSTRWRDLWLKAVGDVDGDGSDDIVVQTEEEGRHLFSGRTLVEGRHLAADLSLAHWEGSLEAPAAGDLDADGHADLTELDEGLCIFYGGPWIRGELELDRAHADAFIEGSIGLPVFGDFDGNGHRDIAATIESEAGVASRVVAVFLGTRQRFAGTLRLEDADWRVYPERSDVPRRLFIGTPGDYDGDGRTDFLVHELDGRREAPVDEQAGAAFLVLGSAGPSMDRLGAREVLVRGDPTPVRTNRIAEHPREVIGFPFSQGGDLDGDGFDELLLEVFRVGEERTVVSLVFGGWDS